MSLFRWFTRTIPFVFLYIYVDLSITLLMEILIIILLFPIAYLLIKFWIWMVNSVMNPMIDRAEKREQKENRSEQEKFYDFRQKRKAQKERDKEQTILDSLNMKRPNPITDDYIIFMRNRGVKIG